ncbi:mfs multidrug transporter [Penicillium cf. griseofulvum]|nr:mfs multidrug transporter [Penicillium cf. griseofulvum]
MTSIFCCLSIKPYRQQKLDHEEKFKAFMQWITSGSFPTLDRISLRADTVPYVLQLVRQVNFGPQEFIRYFAPTGTGSEFVEITENTLLEWNFKKLNSYLTSTGFIKQEVTEIIKV